MGGIWTGGKNSCLQPPVAGKNGQKRPKMPKNGPKWPKNGQKAQKSQKWATTPTKGLNFENFDFLTENVPKWSSFGKGFTPLKTPFWAFSWHFYTTSHIFMWTTLYVLNSLLYQLKIHILSSGDWILVSVAILLCKFLRRTYLRCGAPSSLSQ